MARGKWNPTRRLRQLERSYPAAADIRQKGGWYLAMLGSARQMVMKGEITTQQARDNLAYLKEMRLTEMQMILPVGAILPALPTIATDTLRLNGVEVADPAEDQPVRSEGEYRCIRELWADDNQRGGDNGDSQQ